MSTNIIVRQRCEQLRQKLLQEGLPPAAARVLSARDIEGRDDIVPSVNSLPTPDILPDIESFCSIIKTAIAQGDKICVVGDYDADGMCSTALAVGCLGRLGADVIWRIPQRARHGYGLHPEIVEEAAKEGVAVLLTVDNGSSATDAIVRAKELGLQVCVTDHHLPASPLPPADCMVNPHCAPSTSASALNLSGVGVIFYAMAALRTALKSDLNMRHYLDLVAIGSIADCVQLDKINRALVGGGLDVLRSGDGGIGLRVLTERVCKSSVSCSDIAFRIAPHLNAAGRLSQPELSVELLLADNAAAAHQLAAKLESLNKQRGKLVTDIMQAAAIKPMKNSIVLYDENWPAEALGVLGIIAGRLVDEYQCPSIVLGRHGKNWRGSGRTPAGEWDLHKLTADAAAQVGDAVIKFGGHKRAVGLEVRTPDVFAAAFDKQCCEAAKAQGLLQKTAQWQVDELPPPDEITEEAVDCLQSMVWGEGFPRPQFAGKFSVSRVRQTRDGKHSYLTMHAESLTLPAIAFNRQRVGENIEALFTLSVDQFNGGTMAIIDDMNE